jgi:hypothetical protein
MTFLDQCSDTLNSLTPFLLLHLSLISDRPTVLRCILLVPVQQLPSSLQGSHSWWTSEAWLIMVDQLCLQHPSLLCTHFSASTQHNHNPGWTNSPQYNFFGFTIYPDPSWGKSINHDWPHYYIRVHPQLTSHWYQGTIFPGHSDLLPQLSSSR